MTNKIFAVIFFFMSFLCFFAPSSFCERASSGVAIDSARIKDPKLREISTALAYFIAGAVYDNFDEQEKAVSAYEKVLPLAPEQAVDVYLRLGADFLILEKPDKARAAIEKVLELDERNIKAHLFLAAVYTSKGEFEKAQSLHEEALKYEPENIKVLTFLSDLFVIQREYDKAAEVYEKILQKNKSDAFLYFNLGVIYGKLNLLTEAEKNLTKAIELDQNYLEAKMVLGYMYAEEGIKLDEAVRLLQKAVSAEPENGAYIDSLGWTFFKKGELQKAREHLEKAVKYLPDDAIIREHLGDVYFAQKKFEKAEKEWKRALELNPSNKKVNKKLRTVKGK